MKFALKSVPDLAVVGVLHGDALKKTPELHPVSGGVKKKFQSTNFTMHDNICSMKFALKSVPGLADVPDTL